MSDRQRHGFVLLLVVGLIAASVFVLLTQKTVLGLDLKGGIELVYQGEPSPQTPHVTQDALNRAVDIMRSRVDQLGVSEPSIQTTGNNLITVGLPDVHDVARAENEVGTDRPAALLRLGGQRADAQRQDRGQQLITQDPTAVTISQGAGGGPGVPGAGGMPLYEAAKLAAKQPPQPLSQDPVAQGAGLLPVRRARQRGVRGRGQGQRHHARAGPALPAGGPGLEPAGRLPVAAGRGDQGRDRARDRAAGHRRAPGGQPVGRQIRSSRAAPTPSTSSSRTTSR